MLLSLTGCFRKREFFVPPHKDPNYLLPIGTEIETPNVIEEPHEALWESQQPRSLENPQGLEAWQLSLEDAINIALTNSRVIRSLGRSPLAIPGESLPTNIDPAIIESDPNTGVEAALSEFDARFAMETFWQKGDRPVNSFFPGLTAAIAEADRARFAARLSKTAATGTQFAFLHNVFYDQDNNQSNLFTSAWDIDLTIEARQPILQGAGVGFNRIAGPNGTPGNNNGVLIARVRTDISLADFEINVRNFVSDVENSYWELYYAYRALDTAIVARDSALQTWRDVAAKAEVGARGGSPAEEAQARAQYYRFQAAVEDALSGMDSGLATSGNNAGKLAGAGGVYAREANLRYLMGLPPNDGRVIIPGTEPTMARMAFDWSHISQEGLERRVELRRQRWVLQHQELQLTAARNYMLPRLDGVARYAWRGFGDDLIHPRRQPTRFDNAWQTLTSGDFQEWELGFQLDIPIGYRRAAAGVRNAQLQVARAGAVLREQELKLVHDLDAAVREVERSYQLIQTNFNRRLASREEVSAILAQYKEGTKTVDEVLRAQSRHAEDTIAYYRSLVEYNLAIKNLHFAKGSLLQYNGVMLAEGPWTEEAHIDAETRSRFFHWRPFDYRLMRPGPPLSQGPYDQQRVIGDAEFAAEFEEVPLPEDAPPEEAQPEGDMPHPSPPNVP